MMLTTKTRNAFYHGWFAARARRPLPPPETEEEAIFLGMGFIEGKKSGGKPLELLSKPLNPPRPLLNIDPELVPPTRAVRTGREAQVADEPAAPTPPTLPQEKTMPEEAAPETVASEQKEPALPEKKPQMHLPKKNPFGGASARRRFNL
ncbi:MAG: hypothetical protein ACKVP2_17025 [Burkholderiales bacterium]